MNFSPSQPRRAGRRTGVTLWLVYLTYSLGAQTPAPRTNAPPRPVAERFLLIVDTSAAMEKRAANVERVVGNLFTGGLGEQLHSGDTIGVWTYTDDLHTGEFPLQRWTPQTGAAIATGIVGFLKSRKYEKASRLAPVIEQLKTVVADSDKLTVLLVSEGEGALSGTPFDAQIAEAYQHSAAEQRKQKMPFLTVFRSMKGKFTGFTVNTPPWPVEFPIFPVDPKPVAAVTALPEAKPESPSEPKPAGKVEANPQPKIEPPPVSPATNELPGAGAPTPEITPPVLPKIAAPSPPPTARVAADNPPPAVTPKPNAVVRPSPVVASAESKSLALTLLVAGSVLLIGIVIGAGILLLRFRSRPRVSLITRSLERDPK